MTETQYNFPSDFVSNNEKNSLQYGKQVALVIDQDWFSNGRLNTRKAWIEENRRYSRGEQKTNYREMIEGSNKSGEDSGIKTHKIDYTRLLKIMPVFKDTVTNGIDESLFKPRAEAIDIKAVNTKRDYFKRLDKDFYTKDIANVISEGIGINIVSPKSPKTEKDLKIKKIEYKPDIEIAQELAIENVMKHQKMETIKDKCDEDLFDLGYCITKQYVDSTEGMILKYVDPYYHGCSDFEYDDGRDIRYHFVLEKDTIANLAKLAGGLSKDQLKKLKNRAINKIDDQREYDESADGERLIEFIHFVYLVPKGKIFKKHTKNKITKLIDRSNDDEIYNPARKSRKLEIPYNSWYGGIYVPQDQIMIKWNEVENQIEEGVNTPICPFNIIAPKVKRLSESGHIRFDSMIDRAKPIVDDIQRDWFKFQQLKMEIRPNTTEIDTDAINNVMLNGKILPAKTILDLYFGRGLLLKNKYDEDGDIIENAITEKDGGINNTSLGFFSNEFTNNYNRLRTLLGINELRDGTISQNNRTPAKVQKLLLASSNNNTSHIVKGSFTMSLRIATSTSLMLKDILASKNLKDMYMNIIGTDNVDLLEIIKKIPMHHFGIYFDFKPDDEERVAFEQSLINDLNTGKINSAQYNKARQIRNAKKAIKYLEIVIKENEELAERRKLESQKIQGEINAQSALTAERARQQTATIQWQIKEQEILLKDKLEKEKSEREARIKEVLATTKHQRDLELEQVKGQNTLNYVGVTEQGKNDRIDKASTNASKIADQKANNKPPINFEDELKNVFN